MSDADTILDALRAVASLDVYDGHVGDSDGERMTIAAPLPYVVFYSLTRMPLGVSLAGTSQDSRIRSFQITYVGETREQAELVSIDTRAVLAEHVLDFGDRHALVRLTDDSLDARRDDTWTRPDGGPLFAGADRYDVAV
jgi:hypothetical protein